MTAILDELNARHQELVNLSETADASEVIPQAQEFLKQLAQAGAAVADALQRSQLRALIRFWSSFIYDHTGQFPEVRLLPAIEPAEAHIAAAATRKTSSVESRLLADNEMKRIGPYELLGEIGHGGFSRVYKAFDTITERVVALKVLEHEQFRLSPRFRKRLLEREQVVAGLEHPNLIPIYAVAEHDGQPCIAMQLVESGSLADRMATWDQWRPSIRAVLDIACQVAEGLAYLHSHGIVHRDVKPANILLSFQDHVYLTDFGITQVFESAFEGLIVGTPEYLAPEAILHPDQVDGRADLYSLGIVLYRLFTGRLPFQATSDEQILYLQVNQPVPSMGDTPTEIAAMIHRCLAKDPDQRFRNMEELAGESKQLLLSMPDSILTILLGPFTPGIGIPSQTREITKPIWVERESLSVEVERDRASIQALLPAEAICPQCGATNRPTARYCVRCRTVLASCPHCGTPNRLGAKYCAACGVPLRPAPNKADDVQEEKDELAGDPDIADRGQPAP